jgi:hypothetical protein
MLLLTHECKVALMLCWAGQLLLADHQQPAAASWGLLGLQQHEEALHITQS